MPFEAIKKLDRKYNKGKKSYIELRGKKMRRRFTLEYWLDDGWYVGRLEEVQGVFSQGKTLEELKENIRDAYALMMEEEEQLPIPEKSEEIEIEV